MKGLSTQIKNLLGDLQVKDLPNYPNLNGVFEQTDITFAIVSADMRDDGYLNIKFNVSVAATKRTASLESGDDCCLYPDENMALDDLTDAVIQCLHNKKLSGCKFIKLVGYENYSPESGKWRTLINFEVPYLLTLSNEYCSFLGE